MTQKILKPKIRFSHFTDAWKQHKLGDIGSCQSGVGFPTKEQGGLIGIPFYKVSDMNNYGNEHEMVNANNYVSNEQIVRKKWKPITNVPAIIFAKVGAAIMLNRTRLCRSPFLLDNNTMAYKLGKEWNTDFGKITFERLDLAALVQIGALPSYNALDVENMDVYIPTLQAEQEKIGLFFNKLDNFITLQQRKLEKFKNIKQAFLNKMFPQNDEIPAIRFRGFSDDWEQHKYGREVVLRRGLTFSPQNISKLGIRVLRSSNIFEDKFKIFDNDIFVKAASINIPFIENGDILITAANGSSALIGKHAIVKNIKKNSAVHGGFMLAGTTTQSEFINASMSSNWYKQFLAIYVAGGNGAIGNLKKTDLENYLIPIPSVLEQRKIGLFFNKLDDLIALHQRKLEKLQNIKQALVEKMFV